MGNKRRNKKNRGSKRYNQPLPPLDPNFKQQLYQEGPYIILTQPSRE